MTKKLEFFFDVGSPASYLAYTQIEKVADKAGAELVWCPVLLGGVFKATNNQSPMMVPAKGKWMGLDMKNFAKRYGVPFESNPYFPINTLTLMRGAAGYLGSDKFSKYVAAIYDAMWAHPKDMNDPDVVAEVLTGAGFDKDEFTALVSNPDVKSKLKQDTEEAIERGMFGAPTMFVGDQMFFGQDRLDFVAEALA